MGGSLNVIVILYEILSENISRQLLKYVNVNFMM
jgi:hypothetical protein